jgi:hypothetical protein
MLHKNLQLKKIKLKKVLSSDKKAASAFERRHTTLVKCKNSEINKKAP